MLRLLKGGRMSAPRLSTGIWLLMTAVVLLAAPVVAKSDAALPAVTAPAIFAEVGADVQVSAVAAGAPDAVALVWKGDDPGMVEMTLGDSGLWIGSIPGTAIQGTLLNYKVVALYGLTEVKSKNYKLVVCPTISSYDAEPMELKRSLVANRPWGRNDGDLGADGSFEAATIVPASIVSSKGVVHLLDNVNSRVLSFSKAGKLLGKVDLSTDSASDITADASGDLYVVDQAKGNVLKIASGEAKSFQSADMSDLPAGTKFSIDASGSVLARDASQGELVALRGGPSKLADYVVQVGKGSLLLGLDKGKKAVEINLGIAILDVPEIAVDDQGAVWLLVGALNGEDAALYLVRFDAAKGAAGLAPVKSPVPGDVTRRMTGGDNGVFLFEGDRSEGRIVFFEFTGGEF